VRRGWRRKHECGKEKAPGKVALAEAHRWSVVDERAEVAVCGGGVRWSGRSGEIHGGGRRAAATSILVATVVLWLARVDKQQGGGGGCSRRAPHEEKVARGRKIRPDGGRCLLKVGR
jgi:hypothetical protein